MKVIKLGGSLSYSGQLLGCLTRLSGLPDGVVVVPGGGAFADQVRMAQHNWQFDDDIAHGMAILAMQQMALLFKGLAADCAVAGSVAEIGEQLALGKRVIWSPDRKELDAAGVRACWEISSDSLAAWLAGTLAAEDLVLVKAAAIDSTLSLEQLAQESIIDPAFCDMVKGATYRITVLNADQFEDWVETTDA